jgi:hypothetical protein
LFFGEKELIQLTTTGIERALLAFCVVVPRKRTSLFVDKPENKIIAR